MCDRTNMRRLAPALLCIALLAVQTGVGFAQPAIPAGPAGEVLQAFLKAFNDGYPAAIDTFVKTYDPVDTTDGLV